ncbi:MAG: hypothetical protein INR73_16250 [Williamsia sp.]|nr:hypothetical protein [Williamsia sp.]
MNHDLLKILSDSNKEIDNQKLMDYLSGHLSGNEAHEVESWMAESDLVNDAVEGLQQVKGGKDLEVLVEQLNGDLRKKLQQKKNGRNKRQLKEYPWVYLALVLILALIVIAWFVVHRLNHPLK